MTGLALGYRDRDMAVDGRSVWAPVHGRKTENEAIRVLQKHEEIRAVHVETIKANTEVQQVARLTFDIHDKVTMMMSMIMMMMSMMLIMKSMIR